ncbi:MAG: UTP--glucose-1-phosphate uridylyltransferase, partial [Planctomycetaceae bacterium]
MSRLIDVITSPDDEVRHQSLDAMCSAASLDELLEQCRALDEFRRRSDNLYHRVRALFFLASISRYHIPMRLSGDAAGFLPFEGYDHLLGRRFQEAIDSFLARQKQDGPTVTTASGLADAYHRLAFQTLADQVRRSVRTV